MTVAGKATFVKTLFQGFHAFLDVPEEKCVHNIDPKCYSIIHNCYYCLPEKWNY
jgi:hypothetical protein